MVTDLLKGHEMCMVISITCTIPSKYYAARRNGGKCNFHVSAKSMEEAEQLMYAHILKEHDG